MANILTTTPLLDQIKMFEYLGTLPMNQFNPQINQWNHQYSLLLANQPGVPQATPAPGFEHRFLMAAAQGQLFDQQISASTTSGNEYEEDELDIFNGEPNEASFNLELAKAALRDIDPNQMPDLSVFEEDFQDEGYKPPLEETYQPPSPPVLFKMEAKSPSPCGSEYSYPSASPPHSPSNSEASYNTYSTDEGFGSEDLSELSDLDEILDRMSSSGSPASTHSEPEKLTPVGIKEVPEKKKRSKRGPKPPVKYRGDGPIQLWQFLLELIIAPETSHLVKWTQEEDYEFKILQPAIVAKMWGKKKNKPTMNYEKLSRGLRYYYGKNIIEKVHGKRYVYQFMCDIPKILGYNPMVNKCEDFPEDSVCGEPVMSAEVEDLLLSTSVEEGKITGSLDFSSLLM